MGLAHKCHLSLLGCELITKWERWLIARGDFLLFDKFNRFTVPSKCLVAGDYSLAIVGLIGSLGWCEALFEPVRS